jgi:glycosyltransferase involved in cell wall biosynthesis
MNDFKHYPGRVGLQQRVLPHYRVPFFDHLSSFSLGGLNVFAGQPRDREAIQAATSLGSALYTPARNLHLLWGKYYLCYQRGLVEWLRDWNPDVLVMEANPRYLSNRGAISWMHRKGRSVIGWGLGASQTEGFFSGSRRWLRNRHLFSYDAIIAYSSVGAEQYAEAGVHPGRIHVAINSVTLPPTSFPERESFKDRPPRLLFVGRLQERKRVDLLLKACALMEQEPECCIVGDGPERSALERSSQEIYPQAKFKGAKQGEALDSLFEQADLFVLPGTGGLAVQEALAHGLPAIVAEGDGTQRDLVNEDNGWLVQPGNLDDLSKALRQALSDPEGLLRKGEASYQIALHRANIDAMAKVFITVMNGLSQGNR